MSNAPSLKEPSMEEILASIRRIIESGDERPKPQGDVLHDAPAPAEDEPESVAAEGPNWDFGTLARDHAPANADVAPAATPAANGTDATGDLQADTLSISTETKPVTPAGVFVAEVPDEAMLPEGVALEDTPQPARLGTRVPRREAMPRRSDAPRDGLSLSGAYRRDALATAEAFAEKVGEEPAARLDDSFATRAEPTEAAVEPDSQLPPVPTASEEAPASTAALADRIADAVADDFATEFDEDQFSSELHMAVGFDRPAAGEAGQPAEPSVIAAASSLMSEAAGAQVAAAFDDLARAIRDGQMKSMEEMAREMLRPMLQEWLDDNLPRIVERMVREEIERVSRGPRR